MELFVSLPKKIESKTRANLPEFVIKRLRQEWKLIHQFAHTSLPLSHTLSRNFVELCRNYYIDLEEIAPKRFCTWCSIIQIPTVTSRVRLRHRTKRSKINQHTTKRKIKNEIVNHCLICDRVSSREEVCKRPPSSSAPPSHTVTVTPTSTPSRPSANSTPATSTPTFGNGTKMKNKFNFLEIVSQKKEISKTLVGRGSSVDFIPLSSATASASAPYEDEEKTPKKRSVSLLELEESRKSNKKKRKSLGAQEGDMIQSFPSSPNPTPLPTSTPAPAPFIPTGQGQGQGQGQGRGLVGEGLGSLKSLFSQQHLNAGIGGSLNRSTQESRPGNSQGKSWKHSLKK